MSNEKDVEAEFFLNHIKNAYPQSEMKHYLSAFLSSCRSMTYYLLEEYNQRFGLNLQLSDWLTEETFRDRARQQNNQNALNFLADYQLELQQIRNNAACGFLLKKRNINIHRSTKDAPLHAHANLSENVNVSETINVVVRDKNGNVKQTGTGTSQPSSTAPAQSKSEVTWFFDENDRDDVPAVCTGFLNLIRRMVNTLRQNYP